MHCIHWCTIYHLVVPPLLFCLGRRPCKSQSHKHSTFLSLLAHLRHQLHCAYSRFNVYLLTFIIQTRETLIRYSNSMNFNFSLLIIFLWNVISMPINVRLCPKYRHRKDKQFVVFNKTILSNIKIKTVRFSIFRIDGRYRQKSQTGDPCCKVIRPPLVPALEIRKKKHRIDRRKMSATVRPNLQSAPKPLKACTL